VRDNRKTTAVEIAADLNGHLQNTVSITTVRRGMHRSGFYGRAAIRKLIVSSTNAPRRLEQFINLQNWSLEQ
jgi:hypothetical protein